MQQLVQQLPGAADERKALLVLVEARPLADEHQVGVGVPVAEHHLGALLGERAEHAAPRLLVEGDQVLASLRGGARLHRAQLRSRRAGARAGHRTKTAELAVSF